MNHRTRSLLFFAGTLMLAALFTRLGIWQVSRLRERRAVNRVTQAARSAPAISLDDPTAATGDLHHRRVTVTGRFDHAAEIVIRGQSEGGVPGVRMVTPLRPLRGDTAVLIQRGFVPSPDARTVALDGLDEEGVRTIRGIALALPDAGVAGDPMEQGGRVTWRRVDLPAIRTRLPYPVAGWIVLQLPDSALPALPRRDDAPALDDGPHLYYAIQWFGFAVTAIVVGAIVGFRRS